MSWELPAKGADAKGGGQPGRGQSGVCADRCVMKVAMWGEEPQGGWTAQTRETSPGLREERAETGCCAGVVDRRPVA